MMVTSIMKIREDIHNTVIQYCTVIIENTRHTTHDTRHVFFEFILYLEATVYYIIVVEKLSDTVKLLSNFIPQIYALGHV